MHMLVLILPKLLASECLFPILDEIYFPVNDRKMYVHCFGSGFVVTMMLQKKYFPVNEQMMSACPYTTLDQVLLG